MRYLKSLSAIILITLLAIIFACGENDDPYKTTRPVDQNDKNHDYSNWPAPGPAGGSSGTTNNSGGPDTNPDKPLQIKNLDPQQTRTLCAKNYENYKRHDDTTQPEGRGACLDFAVRRAIQHELDLQTQIVVCEEEYLECISLPDQPTTDESCLNSLAQPTCEATVEEFERCSTEDAKILSSYFLQLNAGTCTEYIVDDSIGGIDALFDNYPPPAECISLFEKCPNIRK